MAGSVSWTRRRYEIAAAMPVVAIFAGLYAWALPTGDPDQSADLYLWVAVPFAVLATLWLSASWLLVNAWWEGGGARVSTMDAPGQLLALTVATLPEPRRRWGEAMLGELTQVHGRSARWWFALSCARAALSLPLPTRRLMLAIVAAGVVVAAVPIAHSVVGGALPGLGFFTAVFVAVVGIAVVLAVARARRVRLPVPLATALVTGAVAASVAATAAFLRWHPAAAEGLSTGRVALLAIALAGCAWLAVAPPPWVGGGRLAPHLGVGAAVIFNLAVLAAIRADLGGLPVLLFLGPTLIFAVPAFIAAAARRSFRFGVQAGVWTAIAIMPIGWALGLLEASRQHAVDGQWLFAGDVTSVGFIVGFNLLLFAFTPLIGFPFAVIGATVGASSRPRSTQIL